MAVIAKKQGTLEYLTAEGISVPHCFTTRRGGVSSGYLSSLNLGLNRGDDPKNVERNFQILADMLGITNEDFVLTRQIHSDIVVKVGRADRGNLMVREASPQCDALITNDPGVALVVFTADCTPILLHDPVTGAVGAAHAGWRGTAAGIAAKTVEAMVREFGCQPENIQAAIGPCIGKCCFETDWDVPQAMLDALGPKALTAITQKGAKYYVDNKFCNALWLQRSGIGVLDISPDCTMCRPDRYWSHRAHGDRRGTQAGIIMLK